MSRLPEVSSSDLVTKSYLDERLAALGLDERFAAVGGRFTTLEEKLTLVIEAKVATCQAALSDQITNQTRTMIFALVSTLVMVTALLVGIR